MGMGMETPGLSVEGLTERIKADTDENIWDEPGRGLFVLGEFLVVSAPQGVQEVIASTLARLEARLGSSLSLESWILSFPETEWLSRRDVLERAGGMPDALFADILALAQKGPARVVATTSALGRTGSPFWSLTGRHAAFVADHDVEIAWGAKAWDPVVESVNDGFLLSAGVLQATEGRLKVTLQSALAETTLGEGLESGAETGGAVHAPSCELVPLKCDVHLQDGRAFVASVAARNGAKGREIWVYVVRARTVTAK